MADKEVGVSSDGVVDQSNLGSTKSQNVNFGVYGQVGGTSLSFAVGTDGVTISLGGQFD